MLPNDRLKVSVHLPAKDKLNDVKDRFEALEDSIKVCYPCIEPVAT